MRVGVLGPHEVAGPHLLDGHEAARGEPHRARGERAPNPRQAGGAREPPGKLGHGGDGTDDGEGVSVEVHLAFDRTSSQPLVPREQVLRVVHRVVAVPGGVDEGAAEVLALREQRLPGPLEVAHPRLCHREGHVRVEQPVPDHAHRAAEVVGQHAPARGVVLPEAAPRVRPVTPDGPARARDTVHHGGRGHRHVLDDVDALDVLERLARVRLCGGPRLVAGLRSHLRRGRAGTRGGRWRRPGPARRVRSGGGIVRTIVVRTSP